MKSANTTTAGGGKPKGGLYDSDDDDMASQNDAAHVKDAKLEKDAHTFFAAYTADGDVLMARGEYAKAVSMYKKALEHQINLDRTVRDAMVRHVLVARSKCYVHLGFADHALLDADRALILWEKARMAEPDNPEVVKDFYKGLLAKADALHCNTEFEMALVYYHRGNNLRLQVKEFQAGIEKCRRAITNAIGDPAQHQLTLDGAQEFHDELRQREEKQKEWRERRQIELKLYNVGDKTLDMSPEVIDAEPLRKAAVRPSGSTTAVPALNLGGKSSALGSAPMEKRLNPEMSARLVSQRNLSSMGGTMTQKRDDPATQVTDLRRHAEDGRSPRARKHARTLLGSLNDDKEYLESLALDKEFQGVLEKDPHVVAAVHGGLKFLDSRREFWGQQKPLYARQREEQQKALTARSHVPRPPRPQKLRPINNGNQTMREVHTTDENKPRQKRRPQSAQTPGGTAVEGSSKKRKPREDYFEATRYAIQTLEAVNNALEYGKPEFGLSLAKNFLARIQGMDLADKPRILGNLYCAMGNTYLELNKLTLAAIQHRKDYDIANMYRFPDAMMRSLGNLGRTYRRMGEHAQAISYFTRQAQLSDNAEDDGRAYFDIARCHFESNNYEEAITAARTSIEMSREAADDSVLARACLLLAGTLYRVKQYSSALPYYEEHITICNRTNQPVAESTQAEAEIVRRLAGTSGDSESTLKPSAAPAAAPVAHV